MVHGLASVIDGRAWRHPRLSAAGDSDGKPQGRYSGKNRSPERIDAVSRWLARGLGTEGAGSDALARPLSARASPMLEDLSEAPAE
ncbi:MAG: hypothetical protein ACLFOB_02985 [Rhodosalinus sp.]